MNSKATDRNRLQEWPGLVPVETQPQLRESECFFPGLNRFFLGSGRFLLAPEMPGRTKNDNSMALDEEGLASFGIPTKAILSFPDLEGTESGQLDGLSTQNSLGDLFDHKVKGLANSFSRKSGSPAMASGKLNDVGSIQWKPPYFGS